MIEQGFSTAWNFQGKTVKVANTFDDLLRYAPETNGIVICTFSGVYDLPGLFRVGSGTIICMFTAPDVLALKAGSQKYIVGFEGVQDAGIIGGHLWHSKQNGRDVDGVWVGDQRGAGSKNILVAYNSVLFANDEGLSTYGDGNQTSIITQDISFVGNMVCSLNEGHPKGVPHAMGGFMNSKGVGNVSFYRQVFFFARDRAPKAASTVNGRSDIVNNLTYGYENVNIQVGGDARVNVIKNGVIPMPGNSAKGAIDLTELDIPVYLEGNQGDPFGSSLRASERYEGPFYDEIETDQLYQELIIGEQVGPLIKSSFDIALLDHARNRTGGMITDVSQLGGYPDVARLHVPLEIPSDIDAVKVMLESMLFGDVVVPPPPPPDEEPEEPIEMKALNIIREGTYKVFAEGIEIGSHNEHKEAYETAFNHKMLNPDDAVSIQPPSERIDHK